VGIFKSKSPLLTVLLGLLATIILIVVLPQVDLPETVLRHDRGPLVACAHAHSGSVTGASSSRFDVSLVSIFLSGPRLRSSHCSAVVLLSTITRIFRC